MKEKYIELMEKSLSAYTEEHIQRYLDRVKTNGLREHGFPRMAANIGILICHGRRRELLPTFIEMMDLCCREIPRVKAENDFSVREVISCLLEVEKSGIVPKEMTDGWRRGLSEIDPKICYNAYAVSPTDTVRNWALFSAASEFFRQEAGLCNSEEFVELQLLQQMQWFDENGMYMDNGVENHQPIMYDLVPRGLYALILDQGYRGKSYEAIDGILKKAGMLTLDMQSSNGEMAFGGRSGQFILNEGWLNAVFEYEAKRYAREKNPALASKFKAASARALAIAEEWLNKKPIRHVKNRYPTETEYGCEDYAYFDKYMITVASNLYLAYLICDDSIPFEPTPDRAPCAAITSEHFHKLFLKNGGYALEFDLDGDPHYDSSGLGRVHLDGAPPVICLSCPMPSQPFYTLDVPEPFDFSLCSCEFYGGLWHFAAGEGRYSVLNFGTEADTAQAKLCCRFPNGKTVEEGYTVGPEGVKISLRGAGELGFALPALSFDGEKSAEISCDEHSLTVTYEGWVCRYDTDGVITDLRRTAANRNGHYSVFVARGDEALDIGITITRQK